VLADDCFWHKADIAIVLNQVRGLPPRFEHNNFLTNIQ
jgi:hypothetical protein